MEERPHPLDVRNAKGGPEPRGDERKERLDKALATMGVITRHPRAQGESGRRPGAPKAGAMAGAGWGWLLAFADAGPASEFRRSGKARRRWVSANSEEIT